MPEFFLELFSEEIPVRMQAQAANKLLEVVEYLASTPDSAKDARAYYGPRRIAVKADIPHQSVQPAVEVRGPRETAPSAAITGFTKKHNALESDLVKEGGYYVLRKPSVVEPMADYIQRVLPEWITANLVWPKSMRWGQGGEFAWVRPLRRIICLLDGKIVPIKLGPVTAGNETEGHRVMAPGTIAVSSACDWKEQLQAHFVYADEDERRQAIRKGFEKADKNLIVVEDAALLEEVNGIVEWPVPMIGRIDEESMALPWEVRELSMKVNQKYFALRDAEGKPAPHFGFVANLEAPDGGEEIISGNERVLRARLSDAQHFWNLDLKMPLDTLLPKLDGITFHRNIGTQRQRSERIAALACEIAETLGADDYQVKQAEWAGKLSKADLVTGMVGEFPELQGIMGGYYAEKNPGGWDGAVVGPAIRAHYQPKGPGDRVPTDLVSISVALADKLHTLVEFFKAGEKPTGSGDPYALRRAALGVIRIILENDLNVDLAPLCLEQGEVLPFIFERLRVKLRSEGRRFDVLDAVLAISADGNLARFMKRVNAVTELFLMEDGQNLLAGYKRAANILRIEAEDFGENRYPQENLFEEDAERDLFDGIAAVRVKISENLESENYTAAVELLARLRPLIDGFFNRVTVNIKQPELRLNRLKILAQFRDTVHYVADISKVEG